MRHVATSSDLERLAVLSMHTAAPEIWHSPDHTAADTATDAAPLTPPKLSLMARALFELVHIEAVMALRGMKGLQNVITRTPVRTRVDGRSEMPTIIRSMNRACIYYVKPVLCLQRAAVVTRLLRRRGIPAMLVIGCQIAPVRSHAWVEVDGKIVSGNKRDRLNHYQVMDRW
jgi:hypothetical protein